MQSIVEQVSTPPTNSSQNIYSNKFSSPVIADSTRTQQFSLQNKHSAAGTERSSIPLNRASEGLRDSQEVSNFSSFTDRLPTTPNMGFSSPIAPSNMNTERNDEYKKLLERNKTDEKIIADLTEDKKNLMRDVESLRQRVKGQEEMLFTLSQERNAMKAELGNMKSSTMKLSQVNKTTAETIQAYQLWHMILVAIVALILGAFLSSS